MVLVGWVVSARACKCVLAGVRVRTGVCGSGSSEGCRTGGRGGIINGADHTEWRVARVDYCKLHDPAVDPPTSQKPTVFLTYGYDFINEQCYPGNRCDLMLPNGIHHR